MMYIALKENRISNPVLLELKLEVVSRAGVLFSDCNATRNGSVQSASPSIVHFDVVKMPKLCFVVVSQRHFYRAEVLVPSPIPPDLIVFPAQPLNFRNQKPVRTKKVLQIDTPQMKLDVPTGMKKMPAKFCAKVTVATNVAPSATKTPADVLFP